MASTVKTLGQAAPAATSETDLYTCPALTTAIVSSIFVSNRGGASATFRISISVGGGATATKDYLYYEIPIPGGDTFASTTGICLSAGDKIRVFASSANLSFNLFGTEIT